jgi:hypothetical protein
VGPQSECKIVTNPCRNSKIPPSVFAFFSIPSQKAPE